MIAIHEVFIFVFIYNALIDSTGGFLDECMTGINVAINVMIKATPTTNATDKILNEIIDIPVCSMNDLSIKNSTILAPITEINEHIALMNKDSAKKILKTSLFLAPIALKIPISFFFEEIDTVIKLRSIKAEKIPKPTPIHKKTCLSILIKLITVATL